MIKARKTKDGKPTWTAEVDIGWQIDPKTGNRQRMRDFQTFDTEREAKRWEKGRKEQAKKDKAGFVQPSKELLADYLTSWLARKEQEGIRPATVASYGTAIRLHLLPGLGPIPLADLSPAAVQRFLDKLRVDGRGSRTIAYARTVLRVALQDAVRLGTIGANPCDRVRPPKQERRRVEAFNREELGLLFHAAAGSRIENLLIFAAYSGLRRGEALALTREDVDLKKATVTVRRNLVEIQGRAILQETAKTEAGNRTVALPAVAVDALSRQQDLQREDRKAALATGKREQYQKNQQEGWIFTTVDGGRLDPNNVSRDYRRIRDKAGLPKAVPFHGLRHTAVSLRIAAGVDLAIISKQIGHKKSSFTADTYGHLLPETDRAATELLDNFLAGRKNAEKSSPTGK